MSPQTHATIGILVLVVNLVVGVWAMSQSRRTEKPTGALRAGALIGFALLVIQVLAGLDLFARGALPAPSSALLSYIHIGGPILALLGAVYHLFVSTRHRVRNYGVASLTTFALGLISYAIGEMGSRLV